MDWKTFRDRLAFGLLIFVIPGMWVAHGARWITLPDTVIGASIMAWTLGIQFYFRKSGPSGNGTTPPPA